MEELLNEILGEMKKLKTEVCGIKLMQDEIYRIVKTIEEKAAETNVITERNEEKLLYLGSDNVKLFKFIDEIREFNKQISKKLIELEQQNVKQTEFVFEKLIKQEYELFNLKQKNITPNSL